MSRTSRFAGTRLIGILTMILCLAVFAAGCNKSSKDGTTPPKDGASSAAGGQSPDVKALAKSVKDMDKRLKKIEALLAQALNRPPEPDPSATYAIPVAATDPYRGAKDAKVTIVEGFEFACGYCFKVRDTIKQLLADYNGKLKVAYKYFVVHDVAIPAGLAACAAHKQGKFAEYEELVWEKGFKAQDLSPEKLTGLAKEAKLDLKKFEEDMKSDSCRDWLKDSQKTLVNFGTSGTPAFYINGRYLSGAQPIDNFKKVIDEELAKADKAIAAGTPASQYYEKHVVGQGLKKLEKPKDEE